MQSDKRFIPVSAPALVGNERTYVLDCIDSGWVSSNGIYIEKFESAFADFCQVKHALSCCNGTVALHLALLALGIGPEDEVIVPTLTYVSTANAVTYCGAKPVFIDSEPLTWTLNPERIESLITSRTKAIIVVHLYGHPADMQPILEIAQKHNLFVIEDAAEAHGALYHGKKVGSIGDVAAFSFYGNKIVTTGEGGMVTTNSDELAAKIRQTKGQGMDPNRRYWFTMVGYNYRMTNIEAALGLAQLEKVSWHIQRRREVARLYQKHLNGVKDINFQPEMPWASNVYWMTSLIVNDDAQISRDALREELARCGIETRPFFYPIHTLPMYRSISNLSAFPVAESLSQRGINLPSSAVLSEDDIAFISNEIASLLS